MSNSNVYPILTTDVPSQHILDMGQQLFSPFNPVLTTEVQISVDTGAVDEDENSIRHAYPDVRIPFGLTAFGTYFATLGNVYSLATRFQDHVTPTVLDTLKNQIGIDPFVPESETVLVSADDSALAVSLETISIPSDWSATVVLHPHLVGCGLTAAPLTLIPGFKGPISLPFTNLNPKMPVRLYRGHGFFAVRFQQHHMSISRLGVGVPETTDVENPSADTEH